MKFSQLTLSLAFLFFASSLFGQKIKDKRVRITYVSLPSEKLPDTHKTYSVSVYGSNLSTAGMSAKGAANAIKMDGFKRVADEGPNGGGHLRVVVYTGYTSQGRADFQSKKSVKKNKETGKETVTYSYWYDVPLSSSPSFKIIDPAGNILQQGSLNMSETKKTKTYSSSSTLRKNYQGLVSGLRKAYAKEAVDKIVSKARGVLKGKYDFNKKSEAEQIYLVKKHDSEDGFTKYYDQINEEWHKLDAATSTDVLKEKFGDALAFYEKQAEMNPGGDKKLKRVFKAANYNAAVLNLYLDDFEEAVRYANRVIAQDDDGKDRRAENIIKSVQSIKKKMDLHGVTTMHYVRDLSDAAPPSVLQAIELEKEELKENNDLLEGHIIINGEKVTGTFASDKEAEELNFGKNGNTSFMVQEGAEKKEYDLTSSEISAFTIGDRSFTKVKYAPCAKGKTDPSDCILEEIYTSDKITLLKYYPDGGALADEKPEYALKKAADASPVSLYDTQFLMLKKGLSKYFADCPDLASMCEEGEFKNDEESLLKAARIYAEVCD